MLFCGIDTSNYTTSAAVCDGDGKILANIKLPLPVRDGECGLRQSDAVFAHVKNLPEVMKKLREVLDGRIPEAVGVSAAPRTVPGSYMPCFLSGVAAAEAFAAGNGAKIYRFSHQQGHVMAAYSTSGALESVIGKDGFIAFHVSGGTTEIIKVTPTDTDLNTELIGETDDANAGQIIDRVGVMLGMKFPCGPQMEKTALLFDGKIKGIRISVNGTKCNLSGLQNIAGKMHADGVSDPEVCRFVFEFIAATLKRMAGNARELRGNLPVIWAGGVMSNSIIRSRLSDLENVYFTEPQFSADNAVGVALLCRKSYLREYNV